MPVVCKSTKGTGREQGVGGSGRKYYSLVLQLLLSVRFLRPEKWKIDDWMCSLQQEGASLDKGCRT